MNYLGSFLEWFSRTFEVEFDKPFTVLQLIRGDYVIRKLPWQPKKGEKYYAPSSVDFDRVICYCWDGFPSDFALKEVGMVFKTEEECEAALPILRKKYLGVE